MDKIQFEYRYEVQELMKVNDKYVKLKEKFEDEYGPLMSKDADSPVQWIKGPWPWEVQ